MILCLSKKREGDFSTVRFVKTVATSDMIFFVIASVFLLAVFLFLTAEKKYKFRRKLLLTSIIRSTKR